MMGVSPGGRAHEESCPGCRAACGGTGPGPGKRQLQARIRRLQRRRESNPRRLKMLTGLWRATFSPSSRQMASTAGSWKGSGPTATAVAPGESEYARVERFRAPRHREDLGRVQRVRPGDAHDVRAVA